MFGTGSERLEGKTFYKGSKMKISLLLTGVERRKGRECSRRKRDCVPLLSRPLRIALVSNSAPALLPMSQRGFRKAVFYSNREKLPQTSFVCLFACFSFCLTSLWINSLLNFKKLAGKRHKYSDGWIHKSYLQQGLAISNSITNPLSQPWGAEKEGLNHSHNALRPN